MRAFIKRRARAETRSAISSSFVRVTFGSSPKASGTSATLASLSRVFHLIVFVFETGGSTSPASIGWFGDWWRA